MTDTGSTPNKKFGQEARELNDADVFLDLDESLDDIPAAPTSNIYTRTGKAAPTEVLPAASAEPSKDSTLDDEPVKIVAGEPQTPSTPEPAPAADTKDTKGVKTESLATVSAGAAAPTSALSPEEPVAEDNVEPAAPAAQPVTLDRGTMDFGVMILRVVLGVVLTLTSLGTFFQLGTNEGLAALQDQLQQAGHAQAAALSIAVPTMQLAAGVFLLLGLITPLAATVAVAVTGFTALDAVAGTVSPFNWDPAAWLTVVLLGMALAVQFTGPGVIGIDYARSWARRPLASSWLGAAVGLAVAGLLWWFL